MSEDNSYSSAHSNTHLFYRIAKDSYMAMNERLNSSRRPKTDGTAGYIITIDLEQKSFRDALIAIVFCGICLESLLHLLIVECKGIEVFEKHDRKSSYEEKLQLLGCDDQSVLKKCKRYRKLRREIVHEKAYKDNKHFRIAQEEAAFSIGLIDDVLRYFHLDAE